MYECISVWHFRGFFLLVTSLLSCTILWENLLSVQGAGGSAHKEVRHGIPGPDVRDSSLQFHQTKFTGPQRRQNFGLLPSRVLTSCICLYPLSRPGLWPLLGLESDHSYSEIHLFMFRSITHDVVSLWGPSPSLLRRPFLIDVKTVFSLNVFDTSLQMV